MAIITSLRVSQDTRSLYCYNGKRCYIMISCTDKKIFQKRGKGVFSRDKQLLKSIMKVKSCLNGLHVLKKVMEVLRKS